MGQIKVNYRQDAAKRQTAGIVFTQRPKIRFFAPPGRLVAPLQVKLCNTDGHLGPLGCAKFHVNRCRRVGMRFWCRFHSLGEIELCAPAVGAKIGVFFWYVTLGLPARGRHSSNKYCVTIYGSIFMRFSLFFFRVFFTMDCSFRFTA